MAKDGHIYKRASIYWSKYYRGGKPYYQSTESAKEFEANQFLRKRLGQIAEGCFFTVLGCSIDTGKGSKIFAPPGIQPERR